MYELLQQNLSRHIRLSPEEFTAFTERVATKTVAKNEHLLQLGEPCRYTHFVNKGWLRLYEITDKGYEKNVLFAKEEWWVSDLYSFHRQKPCMYFLQALEETEVFMISKTDLEEFLLQIPKLERFWRILHINAFIAQQERAMHLISKSAEDRYAEFLKKYPNAELRISQRHIASYLGITPEFLSRMKARQKS